jgi:hypothetical protein
MQEPNKYKLYALDLVAFKIERSLEDHLWTDVFGHKGTKEDKQRLKAEIQSMVDNLYIEYNSLKYGLDNVSHRVYPVACSNCKCVIDYPRFFISLKRDYHIKMIKEGNAFIDGKLYCPECKHEASKKSTGLFGVDDPMLPHKLWSVTCSNLDCANREGIGSFSTNDIKPARDAAIKLGYKLVDGKWYCPECADKGTKECK